MANKIILKKSSVAEKVPTQSDLDYGELAINYTDGKLYYKNSLNDIRSFGELGYTGSQGAVQVTVSSTPPSSPAVGEVWVDADTGVQYFYLDDGSGAQWVELGNPGAVGYTGSQGDSGIEAGITPPVDTTVLWLDEGDQYGEGMYGVPAGGNAGQVLSKVTGTDFDIAWLDLAYRNVRTITTSDNILVTDGIIVINSSSPVVLTLPTATGNSSKSYLFKNLGTSTVTIQGTGGQLIDTYSTLVLEFQNSSVELVSIDTGWIIY